MRIQVCISGYSGAAITLICLLDEDTGVLVVAKQIKYRESKVETKADPDKPEPSFALVADTDLPECEFQFKEEHLKNAIRAYFTRKAQGAIDLMEGLSRYTPDNKIEQDGVDESGRKYRIAGDIDNGQIAVLAACAFLDFQKPIGTTLSAMQEMIDFYSVITI